LQPILNSLLLESSYKLQLPCSQFNDPDPYSVQQPCWLGSAWTELMQEEMLAGGDLNGSYTGLRDRGVRFHLTDELHISWLIRPIHHPKMVTKCRSTTAADYKDCLLVGLTITENYYRGRSSGEETKSAPFTLQTQMEMNSKHDEESLIPWFGPKLPSKYGRFQSPVSAQEIRAKMLSRQRAHVFVGNQSASFQELDGDDERCAELNNLSWHWGLYQIGLIDRPTDRLQSFISRVDARLKRAWKPWADRFPGSFAINATSSSVTKAVRERFQRSGVGLLMADDATAINGGSWIWQPLAYRPIQRDGKIVGVTVRSQMIRNKNDFAVNIFAGLHYCKLLSPARALEWLYTDGYYE
jgi:hypothetical protein